MLDLDSILNKNQKSTQQSDAKSNTSILYSSDACRKRLVEAYMFEGADIPEQLVYNLDNIQGVIKGQAKTLFIELVDSENITEDAKRISHIVPNNILVIIIGAEDAISTIRNLKSLGFYYLFWPVNKQELIDFVRSISATADLSVGLKNNRNAKRVAVIGTKGGVGCSLLTAEIAGILASKHQASSLLVDHSNQHGNCDIMLGKKDLEKRELVLGTLSDNLDEVSAKNLTTTIANYLSYLGLSVAGQSAQIICEFTEDVVSKLAKNFNFVVEDVSSAVYFNNDAEFLCRANDCLIVVIEPTVSSLRTAKKMKVALDKHIAISEKADNKRIKLMFVLNNHRAKNTTTVTEQEISKVLSCPLDYVLPYEVHTGKMLLSGQRQLSNHSKLAKPLHQLVRDIVGEQSHRKLGFVNKSLAMFGISNG